MGFKYKIKNNIFELQNKKRAKIIMKWDLKQSIVKPLTLYYFVASEVP